MMNFDTGSIAPVRRGDGNSATLLNKVLAQVRTYIVEELQKYRGAGRRPRFVKNTGGTTITAWSPMEITSIVDGVAQVSRPTADDIQPGLILFTRDYTIATNATGFGYSAFDEPIQVETDSSTVTEQSEYGTQTDSFELIVGGSGFVCLGDGEDADAVMRPFRGAVPEWTDNVELVITNTVGPELTRALGTDREVVLVYDNPAQPYAMPGAVRTWYGTLVVSTLTYQFWLWVDASDDWYFNIYGTTWYFVPVPKHPQTVTFDADNCPQGSGTYEEVPPSRHYGVSTWEFAQDLF